MSHPNPQHDSGNQYPNHSPAKSSALNKKTDRTPIKLGKGSMSERRYQAERANKDMRKRKTFYTPANKRAGLI